MGNRSMKYNIFWILISLTMVLIVIDISFINLFELISLFIILDFIALLPLVLEEREQMDNIQSYVMMKIDAIEKMCDSILKRIFKEENVDKQEKDIVKWLENF